MWRMSLFVTVLACLYGCAIGLFAENFQAPGTFGDTYGALNTLFSGLAFAGIIASIWMQHEELKLQRKELELQREEMAKQALELKGQHKEIARQREISERYEFERFFTLLFTELKTSHISYTDHDNLIRIVYGDRDITFIKHVNEKIIEIFSNGLYDGKINYYKTYLDNCYYSFFLKKFKTIYTHINNCNDNKNKLYYREILINDLNKAERMLIFIYYTLNDIESAKNDIWIKSLFSEFSNMGT